MKRKEKLLRDKLIKKNPNIIRKEDFLGEA